MTGTTGTTAPTYGTHDADELAREMQPSPAGHLVPKGWQADGFDGGAGDPGPGSVYPGEGQLLYGFVRALQPALVLEIGTAYGYSTIHLAAGCRDNAPDIGRVWTVEVQPNRREHARTHIALAGLMGYVRQYAALPNEAAGIGLAFVDAQHTASAVAGYLGWLAPRLAPGAVVLVHDNQSGQHVRQAVERRPGGAWTMLDMPGTSYGGMSMLQLATGNVT